MNFRHLQLDTFTCFFNVVCHGKLFIHWGSKDGDNFVQRQDQLSRGRGRGGKGRGRGRGRGDKTHEDDEHEDDEHDKPKPETKKRKIATPQTQGHDFWTEEMIEEWNKWTGEEDWNEDWVGDWGNPGNAWDRCAYLDGQVSAYKLKGGSTDNAKEASVSTKGNKVKSKGGVEKTKRKKVEQVEDVKMVELPDVPLDLKNQTNEIAKYLQSFKTKGCKIKKSGGITEAIKHDFKQEFANTDECRYVNYWTRPATGVYLKSEKKDFGSFAVAADAGPFDLRLVGSLKAAQMFAT